MRFAALARNVPDMIRCASTRKAMSTSATPLLLSPAHLHALPSTDVAILDASWFMPNSERKPRDEFLSKRIPGSRYLDLDVVASHHELGLKHMMPNGRVFADACRTFFPGSYVLQHQCRRLAEKFGIEPSSHVVMFVLPTCGGNKLHHNGIHCQI